MKKCDKRALIFTAVLFAAFMLLAFLFPYSGDDWAWGSQIGAERLENWFDGYNGRYAGNLLVMALTRSKWLCAAFMAVCLTAAGLLPSLFAESRNFLAVSLGVALLLFIPRDVFVQAVVWTSGFSNYVPPALLTLYYFVTVKNIFSREEPHYRASAAAACLITGFVGALFMENITVFNIILSVFVIVFVFIRFRRVYAVHIAYFIGSLSGAVLMFTNSAYRLIAEQGDFYRSFFYERGIVDTLTDNIKETFERLFAANTLTLSVLSVLCILLCVSFLRFNKDNRNKKLLLVAVYTNLISLGAVYCRGKLDDWELFYNESGYAVASAVLLFAIGLLYFLSVAVVTFVCIDCRKTREKALFLLFSISAIIAPLMLVSPTGPRCFFPPCLLLNCFCVIIFTYLEKNGFLIGGIKAHFQRLLSALICVILVFLIGVYGIIHHYDTVRNGYIKKQADEGFKSVVTYYLPFSAWVWTGDPDSAPWDESYKSFYGIDENVKFRFVLWEAFEAFKENFEKK